MDSKVEREAKIEGDKVVIESHAVETFSIEEFKTQHGRVIQEFYAIESQLNELKNKLVKLDNIEETPELKEFAEKLDKAQKILEREKLRPQVQNLEKRYAQLNKEIKKFSETIKKLK